MSFMDGPQSQHLILSEPMVQRKRLRVLQWKYSGLTQLRGWTNFITNNLSCHNRQHFSVSNSQFELEDFKKTQVKHCFLFFLSQGEMVSSPPKSRSWKQNKKQFDVVQSVLPVSRDLNFKTEEEESFLSCFMCLQQTKPKDHFQLAHSQCSLINFTLQSNFHEYKFELSNL